MHFEKQIMLIGLCTQVFFCDLAPPYAPYAQYNNSKNGNSQSHFTFCHVTVQYSLATKNINLKTNAVVILVGGIQMLFY
jgi:hypothetical protein